MLLESGTPQDAIGDKKEDKAMESAGKEQKATKTSNKVPTKGKGKSDAEDKRGFIYIGPMLPNGKLKSNAVFMGTLEETKEHLKDVLEAYPLVADLIVPIKELAEQQVKARTSGNYINECYKNVISSTRK